MTDSTVATAHKVTFAAPERILVATDLADSDYLVPYILAQAKASNARITLVHAIVPANSFPIEAGAIPYGDREAIDHEARASLLKMAGQIEANGVSCDIDVQHGFASDVIREAIQDTGATQLIMGTHGRGKLGQFALGSVANELLKTVDIPIFAVGPRALTSSQHALPRKILHPVSLEGDCQKSVDFAIDLAKIYGAQLTLLHVMSPDVQRAHSSERTLNWAKNAVLSLLPKDVNFVPPVQTIATCGHLVEEILSVANRTEADWIVLGVEGDYPLWSLKDSTAYRVLAAASCPVFAVRRNTLAAATEKVKEQATETHFANVVV
jgi:nucleotide-binding universal stress UspA family protein